MDNSSVAEMTDMCVSAVKISLQSAASGSETAAAGLAMSPVTEVVLFSGAIKHPISVLN